MKELYESKFSFLELCPHFYTKKVEQIAGTNGVTSHMVFTYYEVGEPIQSLAEIWVPLHNPSEPFKWKFMQLNTATDKPVYQAQNIGINDVPGWFRKPLEEAKFMYEQWTRLRLLLSGS